ncbi:MAG: hypothetical protein KBC41_02400 [Candidatus Pacebacteria bacterium]|nr:hypothetical protein [Candidatus Paceibacterota bacterium]MBP9866906.1 hypothetical protein [Candidatus Paceibacterota bacterium]
MILATHAVVGTIVATTLTSNPYIAFTIAFGSHFMLDSIPHWDYSLLSFKKDPEGKLNHDMVIGKKFLFDLTRIGIDALIGAIISFTLAFYILDIHSIPLVCATILGGILPDPLQFVYWKTRSRFLLPLQKFHKWIHARSIQIHHTHGLLLQIAIMLLFLLASITVKN